MSIVTSLPTAAEAREHVCLWAMRCGGMQVVSGEVAKRMGVPPKSRVPRWRSAKHLWFLGDLLMEVFNGRLPRLIVSMPPRHGKSKLITQGFTGFWAGHRPDSEIMIASYGDRLTCKSSRKTKGDLIRCGSEVFGVTALERASATQWTPQKDGLPTLGSFLATSAGGTCTGEGADLLVIDDLLKGTAECRSKALRDQAWEFLMDEAMTRLSPGAPVIVVGTRWHPDDPIGRLLAAVRAGGNEDLDAEPWHYVSLPAIAERDDDAIGRKVGEALWPSRFPVKALQRIQHDGRDARSWAALYQCRPVALGGEFFKQKWLRYWKLNGPNAVLQGGRSLPLTSLYTFITCDLAVSTRDKSDFSVIAVWGMDREEKSELLLLEIIRDRMEGPQMLPLIQAAVTRWGAVGAWIEKTVYHTHLIQQARAAGMLIGELVPDKDKKTRAVPATMAMQGGQIYLRGGAPWLTEFEDELLSFPEQGTHDDMVDCLSYAVQLFQDFGASEDEEEFVEPDPDDEWWLGDREEDWI